MPSHRFSDLSRRGPYNLVMCPQCLGEVDFRTRVQSAAAAGFRGISYRTTDYLQDRAAGFSDAEMQAMLTEHDVEMTAIGLADGWSTGLDGLRDAEAFRHMANIFRPCTVNAALLDPVADFDLAITGFRQLCQMARDLCDADCALEFLLFGGISGLEDALRIVCGAAAANGGLIIDLWQMHRTGVTPADLDAVPGRLVKTVQISDARADKFDSVREESRSGRCLPGDGEADLLGYLASIRAMGADPFFEVEVLSADLRAQGPLAAAQAMVSGSARLIEEAGISAGWPSWRRHESRTVETSLC
ncbi:sugar phosphate isomerase/epimerase family protein [Defluviimonas sp. SAOS-178_SWC]|uniref:sugar phosphate isomerase/epimerase family protein n=1 Tax=Defluviimonas sp. SAOS-178_SWC TaxID=3121287 RepID=UPI003221E241